MPIKFRLEEIDGNPTAVIEDEDPLRCALLSHFLPSSLEGVREFLHEIAIVESSGHSSEFEGSMVTGGIYPDHVEIESSLEDDENEEHPKVEILSEELELLLYEWGAALQRWHIQRKRNAAITEIRK